MPDFAKGKVYCIRNAKDNDKIVYVGSTTQDLSARMAQHRKTIVKHPDWKIYKLMTDVGVEHFYIELLVDFPCDRREQLFAEEGRQIRLYKTQLDGANQTVPGRSKNESDHLYYEANKEKLKEYQRTYRAENPDKVSARNKTYRDRQNPDETKAYNKTYYLQHKEAMNAASKAYRDRKKAELAAANTS